MAKQNSTDWDKVTAARDALEKELEGNREVNYVDIGYPDSGANDPSLRVHTSGESDRSAYPQKFDGVSVVISSDCDDT